jgi:hypothetical protein
LIQRLVEVVGVLGDLTDADDHGGARIDCHSRHAKGIHRGERAS